MEVLAPGLLLEAVAVLEATEVPGITNLQEGEHLRSLLLLVILDQLTQLQLVLVVQELLVQVLVVTVLTALLQEQV